MKFKKRFLVSLIILTSCINHDNQNERKVISDTLSVFKVDSSSDKGTLKLTSEIRDTFLFKELPLGYADLFAFKFPAKWEMGTAENDGDGNPENDDYGNTYDNFLNNKVQYFYEQYLSLPSHSAVIDTALVENDSIGLSVVKNIKFRLPDFKQYKVYFSYRFQPSDGMPFGRYGNLVLYDINSNHIKYVEVYKSEAGFAHAFSQYFYIDKSYNIKIKGFSCDEVYIYPSDKVISLEQVVNRK